MDHLNRPDRHLPTRPIPNTSTVKEVSQVPISRHFLPILQPPVRPHYGPSGVYISDKAGKAHYPQTGYLLTQVLDD